MFQSWCQLAALTTFNVLLNPSAGGGGNAKLWEEWSGLKNCVKAGLDKLTPLSGKHILILIDPFLGSFYKVERWRVCWASGLPGGAAACGSESPAQRRERFPVHMCTCAHTHSSCLHVNKLKVKGHLNCSNYSIKSKNLQPLSFGTALLFLLDLQTKPF